jgi:hypothetical protein
MGLLDDAIREHLDLKRRRGGDPVEIEREEREALGPVRRGPEGAEQPPAAPPADEELDPADERFDPSDDDDDRYDYDAEPEWDEDYTDEHESVAPPARDDTQEHLRDEAFGEAEEPPTRRAPAAHPDDRPVAEEYGPETIEYDVEGHLKSENDDDVLEETPEFLQDTPEHDRLWFEQRPPRDFDFDD